MNQIHNEARTAGFMRLLEITIVLGGYVEQGMAERGVTRARAGLIWQLHQHGPVTQRVLSEALRVTPRNVTGLVDALVADGFVARQPHPTDRRATLVTLTEKGDSTAAALADDFEAGAAHLFGDVADADLAGFVRTVDQVMARLRPVGRDGEPPHDRMLTESRRRGSGQRDESPA